MIINIYLRADDVDEEFELPDGLSDQAISNEVWEYLQGFIDCGWEIKDEKR